MQCPQCKRDMQEVDFFGHSVCYKCQYRNKLKIVKQKCRICGKALPEKRLYYCSDACAEHEIVKRKNKHWTKKLPLMKDV